MNNENLTNTCGNCIFFNKSNKMIKRSYDCEHLGLTTNPSSMGCYKIQFSKINK